ncbi:MAG TPA: response regulator [Methylomirabilota bacterium]|nr:response regulator [Methylomirabilota bacterium]
MIRVLMIDGDRVLTQSVAIACVESGVAIRIAETLCEGVRYVLEFPVSVVLVDADILRLSGSDRIGLFDTVAPGLPIVALTRPDARVEDQVRLELQGFQLVAKPFNVTDVLAKVQLARRAPMARPDAASRVETVCG